jgi:ABC-2 type transport system ATP-binding protein
MEDKLFGKLSGGQKQRVLFGLALAGNPELVFLDEPTVGMDIESRRGLWEQIRQLAAQGKTVLLTTHYLEEADMLANRIVVINKGKIIAEGTPSQIKHRVTGRRIRCITRLEEEFLLTLPSVVSVERDREAIVVTAAAAERVVREMLLRDETLHSLEVSAPGLEDAFLALTGSEAK